MPTKKTKAKKVGTKYWLHSGVPRRYKLVSVKNKQGGVNVLSDRMTKKEAKFYAEGYNKKAGKRGKIPFPR